MRRAFALLVLASAAVCAGAGNADAAVVREDSPRLVTAGSASCADPCTIIGVIRTGAGKVVSSPDGIDCGEACFITFVTLDPVYLTAIPAAGQSFTGWSNCPATQPDGRCRVESDSALHCVGASFTGSGPPPKSCPPPPACSDGADNDGDGLIDHPADPDCTGTADFTEHPDPSPPPPPPPPPPATWPARCTIPGSPSGEVIKGTSKRDVICAGGGNDRIYGLGGNDTLVGGKGRDKLYGGAGDDLIIARDRARGDLVNGGPGRDRARIDRGDTLRAIERRV